MKSTQVNIHATAIVIGTRGLLITGPSGVGKSMLALALISSARRLGAFAALVADDRVLVSRHQDQLLAECPATISGLLEIRGSGIAQVETLSAAVLDLAIAVIPSPNEERLPPDGERYVIAGVGELPLIRLCGGLADPLAVIQALSPDFRGELPF